VKLAVMIAEPTEERVLEGVSNPFKVQEVKTKSNGHFFGYSISYINVNIIT
jgi:hypothetical protein